MISDPNKVPRIDLAPGYSISRIVTGGWQLSAGHGGAESGVDDRKSALTTLRMLVDRGFTTFDGADIYTGVEELYGELVAELAQAPEGDRRAEVQIHTKVVPDRDDLGRLQRSYIEAIVDRSLQRLRCERLDLVQFHWWNWQVPGYLEALQWLAELVEQGKIRHLGVTNFDRPHLSEALTAGLPIVGHQLQFSLLDRRPEGRVSTLCDQHGVGLLAYGTLAGGFLSDRWLGRAEPTTGEVAAGNRSLVKYKLIIDDGGGWASFQALLEALRAVADRHRTTIATVALAWSLDELPVAGLVVGVGHARRLDESRRALSLDLDDDDRATISAALAERSALHGDVYQLERRPDGRHAAIMRYNLQAQAQSLAKPGAASSAREA